MLVSGQRVRISTDDSYNELTGAVESINVSGGHRPVRVLMDPIPERCAAVGGLAWFDVHELTVVDTARTYIRSYHAR